ncbi:MAG: PKD domain-containing protein [Mycobacteriales bacterium]
MDAGADAAASGGASPEIAALCRGFAALPVAPGRDQIRRAFEELPLYRGAIRTDPATFTLVNLETYFWCGDATGRDCAAIGEGERRITLLGQQLRIRPRIVGYAWDFGDGTGQRIAGGKATHTYRHAGSASVTVTLTWTADYALGGGAFQPIDDTTTTTSPPRVLPIREAQAVIVR